MARFSSRIRWSLEPGRIAQATVGRERPFLDLTESNPTAAGLHYPPDLLHLLADWRSLRYSPDPLGLTPAREAIARYHGTRINPSQIVISSSTSEGYSWIFRLLCDPGDEILVPRPSYPLFEFLAELDSVRVVHYPMYYAAGWYIDLPAVSQSITPNTRAIVFVNPNNPTGSYLKEAEYEYLVSLCADHDLALIVDEVFGDFPLSPPESSVRSVAGRSDVLTFVLSGLSKVAGLPQMKLGWMVVSGPESLRKEALQRLELIADTFLSASTPVQYAAPRFLERSHDIQDQILQRSRSNLAALRSAVADTAISLLEPEAGWYAPIEVPRIRTEEEWVLHLLERFDVLVQPGFFYDFDSEAYLVLSLLTRSADFEEGVRRTILASKGHDT